MIYGYARVSTSGQARNGNSLDDQTRLILEKYPNATIVNEAYSGAKVRPKFSALLSEIQSGDTLVVTKLDRFCRTVKEGLEYIDELKAKGITLHVLNMGVFDDTPMGRLMQTILLAFAEFERDMIIERTSTGKAIARQNPDFKDGRPKKQVSRSDFEQLFQQQQKGLISVSQACEKLKISRSTWYHLA